MEVARSVIEVTSPKAWLSQFLLVRMLLKGPTGRPLYSYQVTPEEYRCLEEVLKKQAPQAFHPAHEKSWAACFCLYVAETFRRTYDAKEDSWSWKPFERALDRPLSVNQRAQLVQKGLEGYWKRPIRSRQNGRDLLGSLFSEGGLPWPLVQSETHGFGRVVRRGLNLYYRVKAAGHTTASEMAESEQYLPKTFRNLETRQLLAGIVDQLMLLVERHPLKDKPDPAAFLDECASEWRSDFPIPLDEGNARTLINEWLKDAGQRRQERQEALNKAQEFTCAHQLVGELEQWKIRSELVLPKEANLFIDVSGLKSTRFDLAFFEGERLLARGGSVYGRIDGNNVSVRFPSSHVVLDRRDVTQSISVKLLESGNSVHVMHFENSGLELSGQPIIFEQRNDEWWLAACESCSVVGDRIRVRLPKGQGVLSGSTKLLFTETDGSFWFESSEPVRVGNAEECFSIQLCKDSASSARIGLVGNYASFDSTPAVVFKGWPRLDISNDHQFSSDSLTYYINSRSKESTRPEDRYGCMRYRVNNSRGETILQRRFGVLPEKFEVALYPASTSTLARLNVRNALSLDLRIVDHGLSAIAKHVDNDVVIELSHDLTEPPASVTLEVRNRIGGEPIRLRFPFPHEGASLISADGTRLKKTDFTVDELLGVRVALSTGMRQGQTFYITMELKGGAGLRPKRDYVVEVGQAPTTLSLFGYVDDVVQMLAAVSLQDCYVQFSIESHRPLLSINIRRYSGRVHWNEASTFCIADHDLGRRLSDVHVSAMLLSDPKQEPISVPQKTSQGVDTGQFEPADEMYRDGPWLIYPSRKSAALFRPAIFIPANARQSTATDALHSLHHAARTFHPTTNPGAIDDQITEMGNDLSHSGWQYLADLKKHYSHLPLSTFEAWTSLSRNPTALAVALFKLEIDEAFCGRMRDELAVIWESIPLPLWAKVFGGYRTWLKEEGVPEALLASVIDNRRAVLPAVVSGFEFVDAYLETGDRRRLRAVNPALVLPVWYQELRRRHESNDRWPTLLGSALFDWAKGQPMLKPVANMSNMGFTHAVTYLPLFMAYVTAGRASMGDLSVKTGYLKFAIRLLSDFDRSDWYAPVHSLMVSYLLATEQNNKGAE